MGLFDDLVSLPRKGLNEVGNLIGATLGSHEVCKYCKVKCWPGDFVEYSDDTFACKDCHRAAQARRDAQ